MPRAGGKRSASGSGTIRQRKDGTWEARFTLGRDPGTGKQIQKSVYGKTQKEVRQKMTAALSDIDKGIYIEPSKMTVGKWLDTWLKEYTGGIKEQTQIQYEQVCRVHLKPHFGAVTISAIKPHMIQKLYNDLIKAGKSAKTVYYIKPCNRRYYCSIFRQTRAKLSSFQRW